MKSNTYYCNIDGTIRGPFSKQEVETLLKHGKLSLSDQIRRGKNGKWETVESLTVKKQSEYKAVSNSIKPIESTSLFPDVLEPDFLMNNNSQKRDNKPNNSVKRPTIKTWGSLQFCLIVACNCWGIIVEWQRLAFDTIIFSKW